jgi:hypothetical protein
MNKKVGQALTQGFFNPNTGSQNNPYLLWEQATNNLHSKGE